MIHPIYRVPSVNIMRTTIRESIDKLGVDKTEEFYVKSLKNKSDYTEEQLHQLIQAQFQSLVIDEAIAKNGHVHIDVAKEEWESSQSEKTISMMDLDRFKFPFSAGAITMDDELITFYVQHIGKSDQNLRLAQTTSTGVHSVLLKGGKPLSEVLAETHISEKNNTMIYGVLSILLYIATFNDTPSVSTFTRPKSSGSKRKKIPKHTVNSIILKPKIGGSNLGAPKKKNGTKSDKYWIVRGFWRNQYYAKEGINKPKWINPFWKGSGKEEVEKIYKV